MPARSAKVANVCHRSQILRKWLDPGRDLRWLPLAVAEVVQAEVAAPLGREEQSAVPSRQLALDRLERDRLQRHRPLRLAP